MEPPRTSINLHVWKSSGVAQALSSVSMRSSGVPTLLAAFGLPATSLTDAKQAGSGPRRTFPSPAWQPSGVWEGAAVKDQGSAPGFAFDAPPEGRPAGLRKNMQPPNRPLRRATLPGRLGPRPSTAPASSTIEDAGMPSRPNDSVVLGTTEPNSLALRPDRIPKHPSKAEPVPISDEEWRYRAREVAVMRTRAHASQRWR